MATAIQIHPKAERFHAPKAGPIVWGDPKRDADELLNHQNDEFFTARAGYDCPCGHCVTLRSKPFTCELCNYEGYVVVQACDCKRIRADNLRGYKKDMADLRAGRLDYRRISATPEGAERFFRRRLAESLAMPTDGPCAIEEGNINGDCGHGSYSCPICTSGGYANGYEEDFAGKLGWELVRKLRAIVQAQGNG